MVLDDGRAFAGQSFGAGGEIIAPAVVVTAASGYQEYLTDPAHAGLVIVATTPHSGNVGWNDSDSLSESIQAVGYVVRDPSPRPSSWRAKSSLEDEMVAQGIVGICGVDTRALTRHLRGRGRVRVAISTADLDAGSLLRKLRATMEVDHAEA